MQIRGVILLLCSLLVLVAEAQLYSFEGAIPSEWSASSGAIASSSDKYKLGSHSLCWKWEASSTITVAKNEALTTASTHNRGGISCWIYNETPSDQPLVFRGYNNGKQEQCHISFGLNFRGWRMMLAEFRADMGHSGSTLDELVIYAPATGSGTIYLDHFEFTDKVLWERMSDHQITVAQSLSNTDDFRGAYAKDPPITEPTPQELTAIDDIAHRVDEWLLWRSTDYADDPSFKKRKSAIDNWIIRAQRECKKYPLRRLSDSLVQGPGLYPMGLSSAAGDGTPLLYFRNVSENCLIPLAIDFLTNGNLQSKQAVIDILDWYYDQGWAAGSCMGTIRFEKLRSAGYFHAAYLMRHELGTERLSRICRQMRWYSLSGYTILPYMDDEETADNLRTLIQAKLYYALMVRDKALSVSLLKELSRYLDHSFAPSSGYLGTIKPDYSGYHHRGAYFGAYYPQALYAVSLANYWLQNSPFALHKETQSHLKSALLRFAEVAANYDIPSACNGRFPNNPTIMDLLLPAYGYTYLSLGGDQELGAVIRRLWKPSQEPLMSRIGKANTEITHCMTIGEIALMLKVYESASELKGDLHTCSCSYLPYSGLLTQQNAHHHISVKGFSKYVWDYESSTTENLYGRYLSYGQIEYTDRISSRKNNSYNNLFWDWNKIPGTTTKVLNNQELNYLQGGGSRDRNFSDSPFLGGLVINDSTGLFSMLLHDNTFDKSLYACKSVFIKGSVILCLGSGINCQPSTSPIITTLMQQELTEGEPITIDGSPIPSSAACYQNPTLVDNLGVGYVVHEGTVSVSQVGTLACAYINHGNSPVNAGYQYYMIPSANSPQLAQYQSESHAPLEVIQRDNRAHIIRVKADQSESLAIFDHTGTLKSQRIRSVNTPSILSLQPTSCGYQILISDPDMRRGSAPNINKLTIDQIRMASQPFDYEVTINGVYYLDQNQTHITLEHRDTTTIIRLSVVDGQLYSIRLRDQPSTIEGVQKESLFSLQYNPNNQQCTIYSSIKEPFNCNIWNMNGNMLRSFPQVTSPYTIDMSAWRHHLCLMEVGNEYDRAYYKITTY